MTNTVEFPIVGLFHRPPAIGLTKILPLNALLIVRAEPTNAFDSNAIAVDLDLNALELDSHFDLKKEIQDAFDFYAARHAEAPQFSDAMQAGAFHLGYIPATDALRIKTNFPHFYRAKGAFRLGPKAKPYVRFIPNNGE